MRERERERERETDRQTDRQRVTILSGIFSGPVALSFNDLIFNQVSCCYIYNELFFDSIFLILPT